MAESGVPIQVNTIIKTDIITSRSIRNYTD